MELCYTQTLNWGEMKGGRRKRERKEKEREEERKERDRKIDISFITLHKGGMHTYSATHSCSTLLARKETKHPTTVILEKG